jgi:hypothetical protein
MALPLHKEAKLYLKNLNLGLLQVSLIKLFFIKYTNTNLDSRVDVR